MIWSILLIVVGGLVAAVLYVTDVGRDHLRGAENLIDAMRAESEREREAERRRVGW